MKPRLAINGYGRMGRLAFRLAGSGQRIDHSQWNGIEDPGIRRMRPAREDRAADEFMRGMRLRACLQLAQPSPIGDHVVVGEYDQVSLGMPDRFVERAVLAAAGDRDDLDRQSVSVRP